MLLGLTPVTSQDSARALAYELTMDAQMARGRNVVQQAQVLAEQAQHCGWSDVRALAGYVAIVAGCAHGPQRPCAKRDVDDFVRWARASEDPLAIALSLAARAGASAYLNRGAIQLDDLIGAYIAAERVDARVDRVFALHKIADNFHALRMWELSSEIYGRVSRMAASMCSQRALIGALTANRFYALTCELLHATESGDAEKVRGRASRVAALPSTADLGSEVPVEWRPQIEAYDAICRTLVDPDEAEAGRIVALLAAPPTGCPTHRQTRGLLRCVMGWHHMQRRRWTDAEPLILRGTSEILDGADPAFQSFALWLRSRVRNRSLPDEDLQALRDYHTTLLRTAEDSRQALVRSVRARLQTEQLRAERDRFAQESLTDPLTGLANRRALEAHLAHHMAPSTLIIVDIDRFKPVNDRFGHDVGDRVLRRIGQILRDCVRTGDLAARLGGDEFILVLETADREVARRRGHEVRDRIRGDDWSHVHPGLTLAASVGVACGQGGSSALYRAADEALYRAKRSGGARVRMSAGPASDRATAPAQPFSATANS
jgi:diguanylate cyclase (GGDEF)-like protein